VSDGCVRWAPNERWTKLGARGFELRLDSIRELDVTQFSRRSAGVIVRARNDVEVWFWVRRRNPAGLIAAIQSLP
jgi:hypothetical protein